jgi:hypothetical protein
MAAGGVHYLIANHHQILSETVYRSFEVPLLDEIDTWKRRIEEEDTAYNATLRTRTKEIKKMEKAGLALQKSKRRDISAFRTHLVKLTTALDGITQVHTAHAGNLLISSQETSAKILDSSSGLVRAELEIFEGLARKGWTGGGLDELLDRSADPFSAEAPAAQTRSEIFSILPSKSILPSADEEYGVASRSGSRPASIRGANEDRFQSLSRALSDYGADDDERSIFSGRGAEDIKPSRPFSPPPQVVEEEDDAQLENDTVVVSRSPWTTEGSHHESGTTLGH